jgi:hypothetical protein
VGTEAVRKSLAKMSAEQRAQQDFPPPAVLIQPEQIAELVVMFVRNDRLAGRVVVWPDGEPWRLLPVVRGPDGCEYDTGLVKNDALPDRDRVTAR